MFEKLSSVEERYEDIGTRLSDPAVIGDNEKYRSLMKEYKNLTPIVVQTGRPGHHPLRSRRPIEKRAPSLRPVHLIKSSKQLSKAKLKIQ